MNRFPWRRVMRLGLGELGLSPREFWNATLRELIAAVETGEPALQRIDLDQLMRRFPDP